MTSDKPRAQSKSVWSIRNIVYPVLLAIVLVAVIGGALDYINDEPPQPVPQVKESVDERASPAVSAESQPVQPSALPAAVQVNSYAPGREYPLSQWEVVDDPGGFVDAIFVNGELVGLDEVVTVQQGDIIHITGWAGHRLLGMRFPEVLFSACGNIIGGVAVTVARPDVAESAHSNLLYSGWEANLFATDLPACEVPEISVWGRPPVGRTLRALVASTPVKRRVERKSMVQTILATDLLSKPVWAG